MAGSSGNIRVELRPSLTFQVLTVASVGLVLSSLVLRLLWTAGRLQGSDYIVNELFNVDAEANPPTWFGASLLLVAAILAAVNGQARSAAEQRAWWVLAGSLTLMSVDESSSLHEQTISPIRNALDTSGIFYHAWVLVGIPILLLVAWLVRPILGSITGRNRHLVLVAGALYVAGAVGLEMVSGLAASDQPSSVYVIITHAEEFLEFLGVTTLIYALMRIAISGPVGHGR